MGLEIVELIMDCEDEFGISIPSAEVSDVRTVGHFSDLVLMFTRSNGKPEPRDRLDLEQYVWDRVCYLSLRQQKRLKSVTRSTRFVEDLGYG